MMLQLAFTSLFRRKLKKLIKNNVQLRESVQETLSLLSRDPLARSLVTHKVISRQGKRVYSSRVTGDIRILWRHHPRVADTLEVLDIGGHSGSGKVYR